VSPDQIGSLLAGIVLVFAHALPWMARNSAPLIHNPAKLAAGLSALHVLPHYLIVLIWPEESLIYEYMRGNLSPALTQFGLLYSVAVVALLAGIKVGVGNLRTIRRFTVDYNPNYYAASLISLFLYLVSMYFIIQQNGGLAEFLRAAGTQGDYQQGLGILNIIKLPSAYLAILFMTVQHVRTGSPKLLWLIGYILFIVLVEATLGSRRTPIQLILFALLSLYMLRPDKKLFSFLSVFVLLLCGVIFIALLNARDQISGVSDRTALSYITNFSYNDIYMFVMQHFSISGLWYGSVFLDFKYRVTDGLNGWPPPSLDEGVYIYNLFIGRAVEPPMPIDLMANNSWPPRTFGNGYMNFGIFGVIGFHIIQGVMTGAAYRFLIRSGGHPVFLFLFLLLVFSFQVSNLKLTELAAAMAGLVFIFGPMYLMERRSQQGARPF
jgi:oligosaccharide repeat unit polymerase